MVDEFQASLRIAMTAGNEVVISMVIENLIRVDWEEMVNRKTDRVRNSSCAYQKLGGIDIYILFFS